MDRFDDAQGGEGLTTGADVPPIVVDIPGVGRKAFPGTMPPAQIEANIAIIRRQAEIDRGLSTTMPAAGRGTGFSSNLAADRALNMATNPELVAGAASLIPGVGTGAAAAIGGGTSIARDLYRGHTDPIGMTTRAVGHAAVNAVPGMAGKAIERFAMPKMAEVAGDVLSHGPVKGGVLSLVRSALGMGERGTSAIVRGASTGSGLEGMELAGGIPVLSKQGIDALKAAERKLALQGKAFGDPQFDALDDLIRRATEAFTKQGSSPASLAQQAGLPVSTAADRQAMLTAAKQAAAAARGQSIAQRIRLALGLGSEAGSATGMQ